MPDLLLVGSDLDDCARLENVVQPFGYRVKTSHDLKTAKEWIGLRTFEVVLVDNAYSEGDQERLIGEIWNRNPLTTIICFSLDSKAPFPTHARLLGAEVAYGTEALRQVETILSMASARAGKIAAHGAGNFRILVVEDLDAPRDIICSYIENLGFPLVESVSSATQALQAFESDPERYACVVTDVRMPNIDGRDLIEAMRKHPKLQHIPILVLTAYGTTDCLIDCLKAGASGFLVKPPKKTDLLRELARSQRIGCGLASPRLATSQEAEQLREEIEKRLMG